MQILLIESSSVSVGPLADGLRGHGHDVAAAPRVREALLLIDSRAFDAVVLEHSPPEVDGVTALRWLRGGSVTVPVVMLSASDGMADTVAGLDAGADDYMVSPVRVAELDARLRALARGRRWATRQPDTLRAGAISVSPSRGRAWSHDKPLRISELELKLLTQLLANAGTVMTRAVLVAKIWGYDALPDTNIVDVHVSKLRRRLIAQTGIDPITTVRGAGYMIDG